jgi:3-dehydroquinate dehydratase-2
VTPRKILVLSGPNLDRLGKREPHIYGTQTLQDIYAGLQALAHELGVELSCQHSNHEGVLIDWLNGAEEQGFSGVLINPGALTHYSWALHDSLKGCGLPAIEVHLSNPAAREEFRHHSCVGPAALGTVAGFGANSYALALRGLVLKLG